MIFFPEKKYHKNVKESEWSYKGEAKKSDGFKDPKDVRLLRLISEGLLNPQDTLPIVSNDAIISSQINSNYFSILTRTITSTQNKKLINF